MPIVLRVKGYKFFFYEADLANEPPHVHITIERIIEDNRDFLLDAWEKEKSTHVDG